MRPFSLLIKPTSADCNLECTYCFYLDRAELYPCQTEHRMTHEVLEQMIKTYMSTNQPVYSFGWQGGEPTLMGLDFFKKVVELQEKYGQGKRVSNSVQTNGTLITEEMAAFFKKNNFLLGVSLDGIEEVHDTYRKNRGQKGTHHQVLNGIEKLKNQQVDFNILTLVSASNVKRGSEVYNYLTRELGFGFQQYIPCVEFDDSGNHLPFSITGKEWGQFLIDIFNEWKKEDIYKVSIRNFDAILNRMMTGELNMCTMGGNCCQYFVVEHNGDIYPCDFFVTADHKLGNVHDDSWRDMQESEFYNDFGQQKNRWNKNCKRCDYLHYCSGDCIKHRTYQGNKPTNISWLCEGWKMFYKATLDEFRTIARGHMANHMGRPGVPLFEEVRFNRDAPCHCGSGKAYKNCHGR